MDLHIRNRNQWPNRSQTAANKHQSKQKIYHPFLPYFKVHALSQASPIQGLRRRADPDFPGIPPGILKGTHLCLKLTLPIHPNSTFESSDPNFLDILICFICFRYFDTWSIIGGVKTPVIIFNINWFAFRWRMKFQRCTLEQSEYRGLFIINSG